MAPTIKVKFLAGFFLIFSLSLVVLNQVVVRVVETSNEKIITQDLIGLKKNSNVYVKQAFMINHFSSDEIYFRQMAKDMAEELYRAASGDIGAYSVSGELLYATSDNLFAGAVGEDLRHALEGKTAYTISHVNGAAQVYYSYPVVMDGKKVGILRFAKDFSYLFDQSRRILDIILYVTIAIFAAAFIFSYILSRNMTIPIVKLAEASTEVANGNLGIRVSFRRRDEIGKLAGNFNAMVEKINSQIGKIEQDRDRLEQLNRHRKQFFDNVTHELKTPLTSILGYAQMVNDNGKSDEAFFDKGMKHIIGESQRLHDMVLDVLELSKETAAEADYEQVDAGPIVRDVCEAMAFKAERYQMSIQCEAEDGLVVWGSADLLRQVCINIIDNAIKYGDSPSRIAVEAKLAAGQGQVRIAVTNQGEELGPEALANAFEPLYRAKRQSAAERGSRGLGLAICKSIVDDHGGEIRIRSGQHETTVSVELPCLEAREGSI